jgi:methionine--tRNA ligase beta chain
MKDIITYQDFDKLDLRVGKVVAATTPEWSNKLLQFTVDFGPEVGEKTILSGVSKWFQPEYFVGKYYCFVVNLAERKMGEGVSQGMMLMADEDGVPIPFAVEADVKPGLSIR